MSSDNDPKASLPPEARRRGGMDTLFSAAWFDEDAAKAAGGTPGGADRVGPPSVPASIPAEPPPKKSNTTMLVVVGLVVVLLVGGLACAGVAGAVGLWYYLSIPMGVSG